MNVSLTKLKINHKDKTELQDKITTNVKDDKKEHFKKTVYEYLSTRFKDLKEEVSVEEETEEAGNEEIEFREEGNINDDEIKFEEGDTRQPKKSNLQVASGRVLEFDTLENVRSMGTGDENVYYCFNVKVMSTTPSVGETKDKTFGEMAFVFWRSADDDVIIYVFLQNRKSYTWTVLTGHRDCEFPMKFARTFLDPNSIDNISMNSLVGAETGKQRFSFNKNNPFQPSFVMDRFAVVEGFKASLGSNENCQELTNKLQKATKDLKTTKAIIQTGQVKFALDLEGRSLDPGRYIDFLAFIHGTMKQEAGRIANDLQWRFLDFIEKAPLNDCKKANKLFHKQLQSFFQKSAQPENIDLTGILSTPRQDTYESVKIYLHYDNQNIEWAEGGDLRGDEVTLEKIREALSQADLKSTDPDKVVLKFNAGSWMEEKLINMINGVSIFEGLDDGENKQRKLIRCGGLSFLIHIDKYYQELYLFINAVRKTLVQKESLPEILPWSLPQHENSFTMKQLYEFCTTIKGSDEDLKELQDILRKDVQLFVNGQNNLLRTLEDKNHAVWLISLNQSPIIGSKICEEIAKAIKITEKKAKSEIEKIFSEPTVNAKDQDLVKVLNEKEKNIELVKGETDRFRVKLQHLTKDSWEAISRSYPRICPVRLIQFLRTFGDLKGEGDYNELYHLSNCHCQKSDWKYVVGDRILADANHNIELFDVMAIKENEAFLLHVKKNFDASAVRALASQVRVSLECFWNASFDNSTSQNMLEKFYDVARPDKKDEELSIHRRLTKWEMGEIGSTKKEFLKKTIHQKMNIEICLVPCMEKIGNHFHEIAECDLNRTFKPKDFAQKGQRNNPFSALKNINILHPNGKISPSFFNFNKNQFTNALLNEIRNKAQCKDTFDEIGKLLTKSPKNPLFDPASFVSKAEFVSLYNYHFKCHVSPGFKPLKLGVIPINEVCQILNPNVPDHTDKENVTPATTAKPKERKSDENQNQATPRKKSPLLVNSTPQRTPKSSNGKKLKQTTINFTSKTPKNNTPN